MSELPFNEPRTQSSAGSTTPLLKTAGIFLAVFLVGGLGGWITRGFLAGPADVPTMNVFDDWRLFCPARKEAAASCEVSQDVVDQKSGMRIARFVLLKDKDKSAVVALTVPLQVLLEPGIGLKIGDDQVRVFQFKTCTEDGCLSVIPMDDKMQTALGKSDKLGVVVAQPNGKAVELPFSMKGYGVAFAAFLSNEAKRNSWWRRLWS